MVEPKGKVRAEVMGSSRGFKVRNKLSTHVLPGSIVYTDDCSGYDRLPKQDWTHYRVNHSARVYVDGNVHTQTIEGFFSTVKNGIRGVLPLRLKEVVAGLLERVRLALQPARRRRSYVQATSTECGAELADTAAMSDTPHLRPETLDFLYEHTKDAPARQFAAADGLDAKIAQVFAAASVILGLAAVSPPHEQFRRTAFLATAVCAYAVVVVATAWAMGVRKYRNNSHADDLWRNFWVDEVGPIKHALVKSTSEAYAHNRGVINDKGKAVQIAIIATGVEALAVGIALIVAAS